MAVIEKRGELQYRALIRKKGYKPVSVTRTTRAEVETLAKTIESEMERGIYVDHSESERTTVADIIDRFTTEFAPHHYRKREDEKEAWRFQCAKLKEKLGRYSLAALDQKIVAGYRDQRLKEVKDSTVRKELYMLSKIWGFAETECGIQLPRGNPIMKIRRPSDGKGRDRRLSKSEWPKFETQCKRSRNPFLWPAVELAVETAMRQGEALALEWKGVHLEDQIAHVKESKNGEERMVPLSTRAIEILKLLLKMRKKGQTRVIPLERLTLYHVFIAAAKRAKIEDFTFHDLRHEALSRLSERGDLTVLELSEFSGHKTLQMLKRYTHLDARNLAKKINATPATTSNQSA